MAIDWDKVRADFETDGESFEVLASKYGCRPGTVKRRAGKEGWQSTDLASKSPGPGRSSEEPKAAARDKHGEILSAHRSLCRQLRERLVRDIKQGKEVRRLKTGIDALAAIAREERRAWGLGEMGPELIPEDTEDITQEMEHTTVPPGTGPVME